MLVPRPASLLAAPGEFVLDATTTITAPAALGGTARWLQSALRPATGLPLPLARSTHRAITLATDDTLADEAYRLTVTPDGVSVTGGSTAGVFHGCEALRQLLPPAIYGRARVDGRWAIPAVTIDDAPRYAWRGLMIDVARHFVPTRDLLRLLDLLALHRLNTLHLHLTDDQGWRLEVRRFPRLVEVGGWRRESQVGAAQDAPGDGRPHGGYYTQDDIREIVAYAAERHITVVPEIDVPGHCQAAIAAYPQLGVTAQPLEVCTRWGIDPNVLNTEQSTVDFFCHVLDEVVDLFPSPYIGIGGDECPAGQWQDDERSRRLARQRGLPDVSHLPAWFAGQLADHLVAAGRHPFGWDDLLEGPIPDGTVVASWRGMTGARAAARRGHDVVSCPDDHVYLNYRQSDRPDEPIPFAISVTLRDAYDFDPTPEGLTADQEAHVLGGQANLWTEHIDSSRMIDYYLFPRLCAVAEALWSTGERDFDEFSARLARHLRRLDALGVEYRRDGGPLPWQTRPGIEGQPSTKPEWAALIDSLVAHIKG